MLQPRLCLLFASSTSVPIDVTSSMSLPGSKELSEVRNHGRKEKAGWNFSCGRISPRYVPCCSKGIRFPVKCLSSTAGMQNFGMLLNAAKPLALGWRLFWAGTVPVVYSQMGMTESPLVGSVAGWVTFLELGLKL